MDQGSTQCWPGLVPTEPGVRVMGRALIERPGAAGLGGELGDLELPARLQHHGAATRLLDCSRNPFVALWFACRWEPGQDGVLIGFELGQNAVHLHTEMLRHGIDDLLAMPSGRLVSARLKAALNGIWWPLLGFSEESLFPDFDGFALAHGVGKPFPADFITDTAGRPRPPGAPFASV
jgi:hypothetical protein